MGTYLHREVLPRGLNVSIGYAGVGGEKVCRGKEARAGTRSFEKFTGLVKRGSTRAERS